MALQPYDLVVDDEAATAAVEIPPAPVGRVMGDDDVVEPHPVWWRQAERERLLALLVEKQPTRVRADPPLGAPRLLGTLPHGPLEPPSPVGQVVTGIRERAVLVGEHDDVVAEDDEEVGNLFPFVGRASEPLVPEDAGI